MTAQDERTSTEQQGEPRPLIGVEDVAAPKWETADLRVAGASWWQTVRSVPAAVAVIVQLSLRTSPRWAALAAVVHLMSGCVTAFGLLATANVLAELLEQGPTATSPPRPSDPYVALLENMPKPPASLQQEGKILEPAQLTQLNLMDAAEVDLATAAGAKKGRLAVGGTEVTGRRPTPDVLSAIVIPLDSEASAKELLEKLRKYQEANGMLLIEEPLPNMPRSVIFEKSVTADRGLYRGLYVSGNNLIRITTVQEPLTNEAALSGSYRNHTEAMLRVFPATEE